MIKVVPYCQTLLLLISILFTVDLSAAVRKAVYVPEVSSVMVIDGKMDEAFWQQAVEINDFYQFKTAHPFPAKISAKLAHDGNKLYIGIQAPYPAGTKVKSWTARVELLAGNIIDPGFYIQYVWQGGRIRSNNSGESQSWESRNRFTGNMWVSETAIPLSQFKFRDGGCLFNLCITPPNSPISAIWENCGNKLYNLANFGELLLVDYDRAARLRKNHFSKEKFSREAYQKLDRSNIPLLELGPWLHAPERNGISIGFISSIPAAAMVHYREKGSEKWLTQVGNILWGAKSPVKQNHQVHLSRLTSGAVYEYRIELVSADGSVKKVFPADGKAWEFKIPEADKENFSFAVFSDIHNFRQRLDKLMPLAKGCDFLVNLGDMVNIANAPGFFLNGYLAGELEFAASRPLVNLRGNHEFRGLMPELFFEYFRRPDYKPYFMSRLGNLCIIGLDAGEDGREPISMTILSGEREWLKSAVRAPEFQTARHRIILIHIPPMQNNSTTQRVTTLLNGIFTGDKAEKIDLLLAGHTHKASFTPANSSECTIYEPKMQKLQVVKMPFPVICNSGMGETMLKVEVKGDSLEVICLRKDGSELFRQRIHKPQK